MRRTLVLLSFYIVLTPPAQASALLIQGGMILDGSGRAAYRADLRIEGGRIESIGNLQPRPGERVVEAAGKHVAPGFIDLHNHSARGILEKPAAETQVSQGLTTILLGPDGGSPYPAADFLGRVEERGTALNIGVMVGHGTLRRFVLGEDYKRPATSEEVHAMATLVRLGMEQGAFGLSTGLEYDPGFYSETSELIALARVAAAYGGFYMSHIRDEEEGFNEAIAEAVEIGLEAGLPVQISHLKLGNTYVWGRTGEALGRMREAARQGLDVTADCYPYDAWASGLGILIPSRRFDDPEEVRAAYKKVGGAQNVLITRYRPDPSFEFKTLEEISREQGIDPVDLYIRMMAEGGAGVVCRSMSPEDVDAFYADPLVMVASDGGIDSRHPRKAGTYPRVLGRFVRERGVLTLEQAVHKMTAMPARRLGLRDRGRLEAGSRADLVVFDAGRVIDRSEFRDPDLLAEGIELTIVNGAVVWEKGRTTGALPGRILRRN